MIKHQIHSLLPFIFILFLAIACGTNDHQEQESEDDILPDSVDMDGLVMSKEDEACLTVGHQICEWGVSFAQIGAYINDLKLSQWENAEIEDSIRAEDGFRWMQRTIHLADGKIIIEGDFFEEALASDSLLQLSRVSRVTIQSPSFQTPQAIHVGSQLQQLTKLHADSLFEVIAIPEYETITLQLPTESRLIYQIKDKDNQISGANTITNVAVGNLPQGITIYAIVVM